jgi:hypothetical protein
MTSYISRLIFGIFALTMLLTTSAWAWHVDVFVTQEFPQQLQTLHAHNHGSQGVCTDFGGHCCHGSAHFVALLPGNSDAVSVDQDPHLLPYPSRPALAVFTPQERPPQA